MVRIVPGYVVRVDVADGNEYERFQTQKVTKLPGIHRIMSHPMMKLIKSMDPAPGMQA